MLQKQSSIINLIYLIILSTLSLILVAGCGPETKVEYVLKDSSLVSKLNTPTAFRFTPSGQLFIAEKGGVIWFYSSLTDTNPSKVADFHTEVFDLWDRGLLSVEVDPNFPAAPYLYILYTYDAPIGGTAPIYNDSDNRTASTPGPASARLSRLVLQLDGADHYVMKDENVIINDWCQVVPVHSIGTVRFGAEGALYISAGDSADYSTADWGQYENLCGDPIDFGGSLRAQRHGPGSPSPVTINGSIIRVDPATGEAMADNPVQGDRVLAYGLRNPFRFTFRPGTSEIWVGDVGWNAWEEVDRITSTASQINFGWPCYEGGDVNKPFAGTSVCLDLMASLVKNPNRVAMPYYSYNHDESFTSNIPCGNENGSAISGLAFDTGHGSLGHSGALYLADYTRNCIWAMLPGTDGAPDPAQIIPVSNSAQSPVDLQVGPDGELYYLSITLGELHRLTMKPQ